MKEKDFTFMDKAVDDICESMINDPDRWAVDIHTLYDRKTGIEYWNNDGYVVCTWNGHSNEQVFSGAQGDRIQKAYRKMREHKASVQQEKILRRMSGDGEKKQGFWSWLFG